MILGDGLQGAGAAALAWASVGLVRPKLVPTARNYRGIVLPLVLGISLAATSVVVLLLAEFADAAAGRTERPSRLWLVMMIIIVFAAGYIDDRQPSRRRGLGAHLGALLHGEITTGIWKLFAATLAGAIWVVVVHASALRMALGIPLIAGCANLLNLLDVAPGRALKVGLLGGVGLLLVRVTGLVAIVTGASLVLLPLDLRERAMLGDAGANVLGMMLGVALFDRLSVLGLCLALGVILLLHVIAETFSLSRMIDAIAPLRWFDRLGRLKEIPDRP